MFDGTSKKPVLNMNEDLIVTVSEGKLCGKICKDYNGRRFYSFQGIPYAKPPLGKLRFKVRFHLICILYINQGLFTYFSQK